MELVWTATNQGTAPALAPWREVLAVSNAVHGLQTLAERVVTNSLAAGAFEVRTQAVLLPVGLAVGDAFFQVALDSDFAQEVLNSSWQTGNSYVATLPADKTYFWRVKARDGVGNETAYTVPWAFTTSSFSSLTRFLLFRPWFFNFSVVLYIPWRV